MLSVNWNSLHMPELANHSLLNRECCSSLTLPMSYQLPIWTSNCVTLSQRCSVNAVVWQISAKSTLFFSIVWFSTNTKFAGNEINCSMEIDITCTGVICNVCFPVKICQILSCSTRALEQDANLQLYLVCSDLFQPGHCGSSHPVALSCGPHCTSLSEMKGSVKPDY